MEIEKAQNLYPLLEKIAAEKFKTYNIKVTPLSTVGANYTSLLYLAKVSGDGHDDLRLFIKVAVMGETMRAQCHLHSFDNECYVYSKLAIAYTQLEDKHGVPEQLRLRFPKFYGCDTTYFHEVLVLEDLARQGFVLHDRLKPVDWQYASAAVAQLARFHALSIAYARENPKAFEEAKHQFRLRLFSEHKGNQFFYDTAVKTTLEAVREENREKIRGFLAQYNMLKLSAFLDTDRQSVITHGDYRTSNLLLRETKDGTKELLVIDYQNTQYGSPVGDLLYFIFLSTDGCGRAQFFNELVKHYHSELGATLGRLGLRVQDVYSKEEFMLELKEKLPAGLLISCLFLPISLVTDEEAPLLGSDLNLETLAYRNTGQLYKDRLNEAVDDFIAWGVLA